MRDSERPFRFLMTHSPDPTVTDLTKGIYRRLYSGFTKGQRINKLSLSAEAWFWRILATVDDFGNGDADPELCRAATVGRRPSITAKQVSGWLREMCDAGLIRFYAVKGEPFLHVIGFETSQPAGKNGRRIRRYVPPGESEGIQGNPDAVSASYSDNDPDPEDDNEKAAAPPFSGSPFIAALNEFEQHRKEKRNKLTPTARRNLYKKLLDMGEDAATAALIYSTAQGWTGVFPERMNNGTRPTASQRNVSNIEDSLEYLRNLQGQDRQDDPEKPIGLLSS